MEFGCVECHLAGVGLLLHVVGLRMTVKRKLRLILNVGLGRFFQFQVFEYLVVLVLNRNLGVLPSFC